MRKSSFFICDDSLIISHFVWHYYSFFKYSDLIEEKIRATKANKQHFIHFKYLAKLLNAALWGFMHSGTRPVCNCSAMNLCISSAWMQCVKENACERRERERERGMK